MSVSTVSHRTRVPSMPRVFWLKAAALSAAAAAALSGCSGTFLSPTTPLPSMSQAELLRDQIARREAAVAARAGELAAKDSSCAECAAAASSAAKGAAQRLEALGGLWAPWPADLPQSANVERALPVAEAPLLPTDFVALMMDGAQRDLQLVADASVDDEQRPLLLVSALARMASALRLADAYKVGIEGQGVADLRATAAQYSEPDVAAWAAWWAEEPGARQGGSGQALGTANEATGPQSADGLQSGPSQLVGSDEGALGAGAARMWDCVAQELPGVGVESERVEFANERANELLERSTRVLAAGVADERVLRCSLPDSSFGALGRAVLAADLQLLMSSDATLQDFGHAFIAADIRTWYGEVTDAQIAELVTVPPAGLEPATNGL